MNDLQRRDAAVIWHPATHFADLSTDPPLAIARARGSWLYPQEGPPILDAIASWWTSVHGHGCPAIVQALIEQVQRLDHVMFAGFTHEPAVALAELLLEHSPPGYTKVFYADCGSASIEVALKLSYQHHRQSGAPQRRRFAALDNSYHGETLGALAVCGHDTYRATFAGLLQDVVYLPTPDHPDHRHADLELDLAAQDHSASQAIECLQRHAHELAALVIEPLVQCAGRMRMYGSGYLRKIVHAAQALGIHVIADEIAVGFGRTGRLFASQWTDVVPDLLCASKGLSGGVLPLACTLVRDGFDQAFRGEPSRSFLHSHTYTGNPLACAAGLASLQHLLAAPQQHALNQLILALTSAQQEVLAASPYVCHARQAGTIVAFDLDPRLTVDPKGRPARLGLTLRRNALRHGVLLRPLHHTLYWMPPYCLTADELAKLTAATILTIAETAEELLA